MEQEVAQTLQGTWSSDANVRIQAELRLTELQKNPDAGLSFARVALQGGAEASLRQSAALALRRYAKEHWAQDVPDALQARQQIRTLVLQGLGDPLRRIRTACAYTASEIAHHDWPEDWPDLMPTLLQLLESGARDPTDGAMLVLADLVRTDLTEDQLLPLAQQMLPMLGRILGAPELYTPFTRARCVGVFRQCLSSLFMVKEAYPQAVKAVTDDILPQWLAALETLLRRPLGPETADPGGEAWQGLTLRAEIFKTLENVLSGFPKSLAPFLSSFVGLALDHLDSLAVPFATFYLDEGADAPPSQPPSSEDAGDLESGFSRLVSLTLSFLRASAQKHGPTRKAFYDPTNADGGQRLRAAAVAAFRYGRVTVEDEERWDDDPNSFVTDEDDEMVAFTCRTTSVDLLDALIESFQEPGVAALVQALYQVVGEADAQKAAGSSTWWKSYESVLMLTGSLASDLGTSEGSKFNLGEVFEKVVSPYITFTDLPFLQGRCFVFSSQFAKRLPQQHTERIAAIGCEALQRPDMAVVVKLSVVRAVRNFFRHLPDVVAPYSGQVVAQVAQLLPQTTDATAILLVETLQAALLPVQDSLDLDSLVSVVEVVVAAWRKTPSDPLLVDATGDLLGTLSSSPSPTVTEALRQKAIPLLASFLPDPACSSAAMVILESVFKARPSPIGHGVFAAVADPLFDTLVTADDADVLQDGMDILTSVIRKDVDQVLDWRSPAHGSSGLDLVLRAVAHVLAPQQSETGGLAVGDLLLHLLRKAGDKVSTILPDLLKTLAHRVGVAKTATFTQSMILPFAYLINSQTDTVLALLETFEVSTPSGPKSALQVVLSAWCDNADGFQGAWNIRVSTVGLAQVYLSNRPSLDTVTVRGERILTASNINTIMTRAKARANPDQFEVLPLRLKILKLLVAELQGQLVDGQEGVVGATADAVDDDDGDDDWEDDEAGGLSAQTRGDLLQLSDMLGPAARHILSESDLEGDRMNGAGGHDLDGDDDDDLRDDPIQRLDVRQHLVGFFRHAYAAQGQGFGQGLTGDEVQVLRQVLT